MTAAFLETSVLDELTKELQSGKYLNLSKINGDKKVRFFGTGIKGWEAWTEDNKPLRWESKPSEYPANIKRDEDGTVNIKRFIAAAIWDYDDEMFKIINLNKTTVLKKFLTYCKAEEYGNPTTYDIRISRTGTGMDTEYELLALPPKAVTKEIATAYAAECANWNLAAMFDGDDPFGESAV